MALQHQRKIATRYMGSCPMYLLSTLMVIYMKPTDFNNIKLAGVTHREAQDVIRDIIVGSGVQDFELVREPNNQFDANAVRVNCMTLFIGYIPQNLSAKVAQIMDAGTTLKGQLNKVNKSPGHATLGLTIDIVESKNMQEMSAGDD